MKIVKKSVMGLSPKDYSYLYGLNLRGGGLMQCEIQAARRRKSYKEQTYRLYVNREMRGWALVFWEYNRRKPTVYFYTKQKYRKKGYASLLMNRVLEDYASVRVKPWSADSGGLFKKYKNNVTYDPTDRYWMNS